MTTKLFDAYFLNGDEGKAIKLWSFEVESALDALEAARANLHKAGIVPNGNTCLQVVRSDEPPMDVLAWKNRRCLPRSSDSDGLGAVRAEAAMRGLPVRDVIQRSINEENTKLAEIEKEQFFGLSEMCPQMKVWQNRAVRCHIMPETKPRRTFEELIDALCEDDKEG